MLENIDLIYLDIEGNSTDEEIKNKMLDDVLYYSRRPGGITFSKKRGNCFACVSSYISASFSDISAVVFTLENELNNQRKTNKKKNKETDLTKEDEK